AFEERDIKPGTMYWYLLALGLATAGALLICIFVLRFTSNLAASSEAPPPPSRVAQSKDARMPPEPRLQGVPGHPNDPQKDLREKLQADTAATMPPVVQNVGFEPELNRQVPLDVPFQDESGRSVQLRDYFHRKPVVLAFVYYRCPMLCNQVQQGVVGALRMLSFNPGHDYEV